MSCGLTYRYGNESKTRRQGYPKHQKTACAVQQKHFTFNQMKRIFRHYGITARLVDITTHQDLWNKMSRTSLEHERALEVAKWARDNKITNWIAIDDLDLYHSFKWLTPRVSMWRHVQVDGDHGVGGRLRDKVDECIEKLNR